MYIVLGSKNYDTYYGNKPELQPEMNGSMFVLSTIVLMCKYTWINGSVHFPSRFLLNYLILIYTYHVDSNITDVKMKIPIGILCDPQNIKGEINATL